MAREPNEDRPPERGRSGADEQAEAAAPPNACSGPDDINCRDAVTAVQEFLDGALADMSATQVRAHFERCATCYPHLRFEQAFREAVARASRGECAPAELRSRLQAILEDVEREPSK